MLPDGLAEGDSLLCVHSGLVHTALADTYAYDRAPHARKVEGLHSGVKACSLFSEAVFYRDPYILKEQVGGDRRADTHLVFVVSYGESRSSLVYEEGGHSPGALRLVCHSSDYEEVGYLCVGDEALSAVYDVLVAFADGYGLAVSGVAACVRLCKGKGAPSAVHYDVAALLLLLFVSCDEHGLKSQAVSVESYGYACVGFGYLFHYGSLVYVGKAESAVLFGDVHH